MVKCIVCGRPVIWKKIVEAFREFFDRVDHFGEDSLTEQEQTVYQGKVCSNDCFFYLD